VVLLEESGAVLAAVVVAVSLDEAWHTAVCCHAAVGIAAADEGSRAGCGARPVNRGAGGWICSKEERKERLWRRPDLPRDCCCAVLLILLDLDMAEGEVPCCCGGYRRCQCEGGPGPADWAVVRISPETSGGSRGVGGCCC